MDAATGAAVSRRGSKASCDRWGDQESLIAGMQGSPQRVVEDEPPLSADELDLPSIQSYKSNERLFRQRRSVTALTLTGAGLLALSGCIVGYLWQGGAQQSKRPGDSSVQLWDGGECDFRRWPSCPALGLLKMPEVHELAALNLLRVGHRMLSPKHAPAVKSVVRGCFRNVTAQLERHARQVVRELDMVRFSRPQKDATLNSLRLLGDPRIEAIGLDVALALDGLPSKPEANASRADLVEALTGMLERFELGALTEELELARLLWTEGSQWALTLEPEHLGSMGGVSERWHDAIDEAAAHKLGDPDWHAAAPAPLDEPTRSAIIAGALVQARVLLDIMRVRARSALPTWVTSPSSYLGIHRQDVACGIRGSGAALNSLACPLKFGVQGMDALRAHFDHRIVAQDFSSSTPAPATLMVAGL